MGQSEYKIFGHRGCRGLYPENTIVGFQKAIQMGVDGIEFDIVLNKNLQIIVSHEPYVDTSYCISNLNQDHSLNIFEMSLDEIKKIDCGSKYIRLVYCKIIIKGQCISAVSQAFYTSVGILYKQTSCVI